MTLRIPLNAPFFDFLFLNPKPEIGKKHACSVENKIEIICLWIFAAIVDTQEVRKWYFKKLCKLIINFWLVCAEHAHASYPRLDPRLSFRPPGLSPYEGREERRVRGLDYDPSSCDQTPLAGLQASSLCGA